MESSPQKGTDDKPNDKALITMALGEQLPTPTKAQGAFGAKTCRGFLKNQAKAVSKPLVKTSEYTFFKKKVRLNVVEKKVHQFDLDEDEVNQKKAKKKTSARKNY